MDFVKWMDNTLGIVGFLIICLLAFTIPEDPYQIIPAMTVFNFDKPLWANIIIAGGFVWLIVYVEIYDRTVGLDD